MSKKRNNQNLIPKPDSHSIFQESEDSYNWDKYLEQLEFIELTESQRKRAYQAIQFLRSLFGENFLRKCFSNRHPFSYELANSAPMARLRLTRFAESLQSLQNADGFGEIIKRLKKFREPDKFIETSSVVETASKFQKAGFEIIFEPTVEIITTSGIKKHKKPDLKIVNRKTGEQIFVEVSRLRPSDGQVLSDKSFNTIWFLIHRIMDDSLCIEYNKEKNEQINHHILPYANILEHLDEKDLAEISEKIRTLAQKVTETNEFQELVIKGKIEVAISPFYDHSKAREWAKERGLKDLVESPPIPLHETYRTRLKIGDKIRQLPQDTPGIIVIPTKETLLFFAYGIKQIIDDVKSELLQYPQLMYVGLSMQVGETPKESVTISINEDLFTKKMREDFITESNMLIHNPAFNLQVSKATIKQIKQAFIKN